MMQLKFPEKLVHTVTLVNSCNDVTWRLGEVFVTWFVTHIQVLLEQNTSD